jgi:MoaA/NifB/PqqE/SkfB family radical SAM enzyme
MRYDIEADWQLLNTCNYRCEYCFFGPQLLGEKLTVFADPDAWKQALDQTGLTWLLHITGGEPSIYPHFPDLCELLSQKHYLSFNSNLSHRSIADFAKRVSPTRIAFVNAGLHPDERQRRKGLARFLEHVCLLRESHFRVFISIVCTPEVLARFSEIAGFTAAIGLSPVPKMMRGPYRGKSYPAAYSADERRMFASWAAIARMSYGNMGFGETPTIDVFGDENYLDGTPEFRGRLCSAGEKFVKLLPDGAVFRCEVKDSSTRYAQVAAAAKPTSLNLPASRSRRARCGVQNGQQRACHGAP